VVTQHEQGFEQSTDWKSNRGFMPSPPNGVKMTDYQVISEIDVLISVTLFLAERGVKPYKFSPPRGKRIDTQPVLVQREWDKSTSQLSLS